MKDLTLEKKIYYTLRIGVAMCFIGHGAFGLITKQVWCNYFAVFGIGEITAYRLMPVIGSFDFLMGILMLVYPMRIIPGWLVFWGIFTALLRPLANEPFAEFVERAGNFGVPLAMLLLYSGSITFKGWFQKMKPDVTANEETIIRVALCLRITVFLLLAGHGWLNVIQKQGLLNQYTSIGLSNPAATAQAIGIFEIIAAFTVLIRPLRQILLLLLIWKAVSELFYPKYEFFEWIERGASYAAILGLWLVTHKTAAQSYLSQIFKKTSSA
ncbi:MAG: hypothetical protein ABI543_01190 [Ignavibacteria bacterium]